LFLVHQRTCSATFLIAACIAHTCVTLASVLFCSTCTMTDGQQRFTALVMLLSNLSTSYISCMYQSLVSLLRPFCSLHR
jgi:hypothetical protein